MIEKAATHQAHFLIKAFIAYVYFIQGFYLNLGSTIVLLYPKFPSPDVLSHFSIAYLPFSFKYVTAPLVQKFTNISYGRRKFWIVLSLLMTTALSFPLISNLTNPEEHPTVIAMIFIILLFVSMGDIALDAASVKELQNPVLSSVLQLFFQSLGQIAGGLLMIRVVRPTDWILFKTQSLCSAESFTLAVGILNGLIAVLLHCFYRQRVIKEESEEKTPSLKSILKFYQHFVNPKYKLCRFGIYLILFWQGLKFLRVGFEPEAIYRGFSKELIPEIHTICIFVSIGVNIILSKYATEENLLQLVRKIYWIQVVVFAMIYLSDCFSNQMVIASIIIIQLIHMMEFLLNSSKVNTFGEASLAGLSITTLASLMNFGNNSWLQLKVISMIGYNYSVAAGLIIGLITAIYSGRIMVWIESGLPEDMPQEDQVKKEE